MNEQTRSDSVIPQHYSSSPSHLMANRGYIALLIGQTLSRAGDQFVLIAALYIINDLIGSRLAIAGIAMALSLPRLAFGMAAGVAVDRWSRKRVMIISDLLRAVVVLFPLLIPLTGQIWILYVVALLLGVLVTFFEPARNASIPNLVQPEELLMANSVLQGGYLVGTIFGAAAAGIAVSELGMYSAFAIDSLTFIFSAVAIALVHIPQRTPDRDRSDIHSLWQQMGEGIRFIFSSQVLTRVMGVTAVAALGLSAIMILGVSYLEQDLGVNASAFGFVIASMGIGIALGGAAARTIFKRFSLPTIVGTCLMMVGVTVMGFVLASNYWAMVVGAMAVGVGIVVARAGLNTITQSLTPDSLRGRVESAVTMIIGLSNAGSQAFSGIMGDILSAPIIFLGAGAVTVIAGLASQFSLNPNIKDHS